MQEIEGIEFFDRLYDLLTDHKKQLFSKLVKERTRRISWLADNLYHEQNASAIIRSADCFGFSEIYVLEDKYRYKVNEEIAMGAQKWVRPKALHAENGKYESALKIIKSKGYRIIAASPHASGNTLEDLDLSTPLCIALGSERHGLHPEIIQQADGFVMIPMVGFTESLNVSVTAGILMYRLRKRLIEENIPWQLTPEQEKEQLFEWALKTVPNAQKMIKRWFEEKAKNS
ncbi:tRNA (guanosine(18)-2'-O)-methyltransferase [Thermaurantimonas aggregans]|uniref:tRNA (guanosine(18)-2'-O)-methyltransferase n=1 Tax=Thermaurantimonas aggregans TaxID=2173829 RepID=A0A401XKS9_9FLAO|nr:RNA methyltransferase [Thermaurantimonas aggregans]MCX8148200.1 RNA methyltransferase [Thermaurantimonas aggregans]GCD77629.1 tRNA (guanosine(18)-2'-O)-methyltransferase [Thermaurantimonas aggregans]